ncbi:MAG: hypothetical protein DMG10_28585 [Acidobacteria bacterium]|nr:MAG: hypothetical protein DMG10_28585 [Acidobacteriota bacterium]
MILFSALAAAAPAGSGPEFLESFTLLPSCARLTLFHFRSQNSGPFRASDQENVDENRVKNTVPIFVPMLSKKKGTF